MSKRFNFVFALLVISSMLLSACAPAATPAATSAPAAQATTAPAQPTTAGPLKIVYIPKNTGNPYFDSIIAGFKKACDELKCEFTTTAPATAMAVYQAARNGVKNFSLLVSHVLVPPAIEAILAAPDCRVQGFLAAGHVCTVMGYEEYVPLAAAYRVPIVVTGFEPVDILQGVLMCVAQLESGRAEVQNQYSRSVRREGNRPAQQLIRQVFEVTARKWRGIGEIPRSGLGLREAYAGFDAERRFHLADLRVEEPMECKSGQVLRGKIRPDECPAFGDKCTPEHPLGAPMVSSEGACAAYYRYRRAAPPSVRP